jgi:hypothetical protein
VQYTPSWVAGPRVGAGGGMVAMTTVGVEAARVVSSPAAGCASPLDRLGFGVSVGCTARSTWWSVPPAPHLLLCGAGRWGPTSHMGWAPPIRARLWGQCLTQICWGSGRAGDQTNSVNSDGKLWNWAGREVDIRRSKDLCIEPDCK